MVMFGTIEGALAKVQEVECMLSPLTTTHNKFSDSLQFINGGTAVRKSADSHKKYELTYRGDVAGSGGIDTVMDYYHGEYGQGLIYFCDPSLIGDKFNVLRRNWATPALIQTGYKNIYHTEPTFTSATLTPTVTYTLDDEAGRYFTILVPANHTLWLGGKYSGTGNATIAIYKDEVSVGSITKSAIDSNALLTDNVAGAGVVRIRIEGDNGDTITIQSLIAQILPNSMTGATNGEHIRGSGVSGMRFSTDSLPYEVTSAVNGVRGFSVELTEVEEWL